MHTHLNERISRSTAAMPIPLNNSSSASSEQAETGAESMLAETSGKEGLGWQGRHGRPTVAGFKAFLELALES